jgi:hypothetical protein
MIEPMDASQEVVHARPQRLRVVCWVSALVIVAVFTLVASALRGGTEGGGTFAAGDQAAMVGLGVLLAAGVLAMSRPRLVADADGLRIRNIVGGYTLPWAVVRSIRFDDHSPWVSLELADDDTVPVMAVQAADKAYAVSAVRRLRALLEAHQAEPGPGSPHPQS